MKPVLKQDLQYLKLFWRYISQFRVSFWISLACVPVISLLHLSEPLLIRYGIDTVIPSQNFHVFLTVVLAYFMCVLGEWVLRSLQSYLFQKMGNQCIAQLRRDLMDKLINLSQNYLDRVPRGTLVTRATNDLESLTESFSSGIVTLATDLINLAGITMILLFLNWKLCLITTLVFPVMTCLVYFFKGRLRKWYGETRQASAALNAYLQEQVEGISTVRSSLRGKTNAGVFLKKNQTLLRSVMHSVFYDALLYSIVESLTFVTMATVLVGYYKLDDALTLGTLVAFMEYLHRFFGPLRELSNKFAIFQQAFSSMEKVFQSILNQEYETSGGDYQDFGPSDIKFSNVTFAYKNVPDKQVITEFNAHIENGSSVALVGPTGSGKTTLCRLLNLLYSEYSGTILIGGRELREYRLDNIRDCMTVVLQDVVLFNQSITFNLTLGDSRVTPEKIQEVCKAVGIHEWIIKMPNGYETVLFRGGNQVSMGQAQILTLVRALLRPSPIVILDEPTAMIDSIHETLVNRAINLLLKEKTTIVVAHRLSTVKKVDKIFVIRDGRLIEEGNHTNLMKKDGFYSKLYLTALH